LQHHFITLDLIWGACSSHKSKYLRNIALFELSNSKTIHQTIALRMPFTIMLRILLIRLVSQLDFFKSVSVSIYVADDVIFQGAGNSNPPSQSFQRRCRVL
jgi:hypothetical protein